eukprot:TRINITY_DN94208_c0_g1_i1.p1 TRINITY_DN94208_c0_g1~~TRINITY_DN94208_c0_g1_i1.p1  ORF type:complete len:158 (-),score=48.73 TRINITY_DN94208_c0_g1_i1:413-886(-)
MNSEAPPPPPPPPPPVDSTCAAPEALELVDGQLLPHFEHFKTWLFSEEGFGKYLDTFFRENGQYFDAFSEEHALHYTTLHQDFSTKFEAEVQGWLKDEGLREEDLERLLRLGQSAGDEDTELILETMANVLEYDKWIANIMQLKKRIAARKIRRVKR